MSSVTALAVVLNVFTLRARPVVARGNGAGETLPHRAGAGGPCDSEHDAVRQAVVRYFAAKYTDVLCLSLSDDDVSVTCAAGEPCGPPRTAPTLKDPEHAFITTLNDLSSRVRPGSACRLRERKGQPPVLRVPHRDAISDKRTGRQAIDLLVGRVQCLETGRATVTAHAYCGSLCGSWRTCQVEYRDERWEVSDCRLDAVSSTANWRVS